MRFRLFDDELSLDGGHLHMAGGVRDLTGGPTSKRGWRRPFVIDKCAPFHDKGVNGSYILKKSKSKAGEAAVILEITAPKSFP